MKEQFEILKKKGYTNEAFESYIKNPNIRKIYTEELLNELRALWYADNIIEQEAEVLEKLSEEKPYENMNKDELDEYAINTYGIDLDKRFKKETMIEELEEELKKQNEE